MALIDPGGAVAVTVRGAWQGDIWVNTWTVARESGDQTFPTSAEHVQIADAFGDYYRDCAARRHLGWAVLGIDTQSIALAGGTVLHHAEVAAGTDTAEPLPPQICTRMTLIQREALLAPIYGGPYLNGATITANTSNGRIDTPWRSAELLAVAALDTQLDGFGYSLAIGKRSSGGTTYVGVYLATHARMGHVWDTMRSRRNALIENYDEVTI